MARDERLGLGDKLALAALDKVRGKEKDSAIDPSMRHLPKGAATPPLFWHPHACLQTPGYCFGVDHPPPPNDYVHPYLFTLNMH